ncbi:MFS transporter [Xenorhabdus doucetiae]|uniref:MFS family arabinose efflux permease n=2 Tax=Xenorhabdus doucetiae TaxID=351671 RepID=A0A068QUX6_9GAMM|nr:MFS transporter [Xenorhabdus doucetiae]TYP02001.1 putative MFS family arabinose efflux permease [Xenorhabdus doucetiae]CDG18594.1 putative efflux protein [Xenorhabdus doucetiae]
MKNSLFNIANHHPATTKHQSASPATYILAIGIFAMVTSEFQVTGMVPIMAYDLGVSISQIGYLVSLYALAMAFGGPLLAIGLLKTPPKRALIILYMIFIIGEVVGALANSYLMLMVARVITGAVSGAFFGVALAICVEIAGEQQRGWAISIVLSGIMLGTILGLPMANLIGTYAGWRESFWTTSLLAVIAGVISVFYLPPISPPSTISLRTELGGLKNLRLWRVFSTSLLIIGATFAAFTYFTPILKEVTGYNDNMIASLLILYGAATIIGNIAVGKLADRHTIPTLTIGLISLTVFLLLFSLFADKKLLAALSLIGIGLVGVTMNPAMATRVMRTANGRQLINTIHTSVITLGVVTGSFLGGFCIHLGWGLRAPLWVGGGMALLGLITLLPDIYTLYKENNMTKK